MGKVCVGCGSREDRVGVETATDKLSQPFAASGSLLFCCPPFQNRSHQPSFFNHTLLALPAGAVPKDGPSAGITLAVALVSLFTDRCVRPDAAMTGAWVRVWSVRVRCVGRLGWGLGVGAEVAECSADGSAAASM